MEENDANDSRHTETDSVPARPFRCIHSLLTLVLVLICDILCKRLNDVMLFALHDTRMLGFLHVEDLSTCVQKLGAIFRLVATHHKDFSVAQTTLQARDVQ